MPSSACAPAIIVGRRGPVLSLALPFVTSEEARRRVAMRSSSSLMSAGVSPICEGLQCSISFSKRNRCIVSSISVQYTQWRGLEEESERSQNTWTNIVSEEAVACAWASGKNRLYSFRQAVSKVIIWLFPYLMRAASTDWAVQRSNSTPRRNPGSTQPPIQLPGSA